MQERWQNGLSCTSTWTVSTLLLRCMNIRILRENRLSSVQIPGRGPGVVLYGTVYMKREHRASIPRCRYRRPIPSARERYSSRLNSPLYIHTSEQVMALVKSTGFSFQQVSIDEAFLDVSPLSGYAAASLLAQQIKTEIEKTLGITCSIGIAPTKIVAKIASDYQKPNGVTVVEPDHVISFLAPLAVRKIPGIGAKTETLLHQMGIRTIGRVAGFDVQALIAKFGNSGVAMHDAALGIDDSEVIEREGSRSVSRMTTFAEDTDDTVLLAETMGSLADELYRTLKKDGFRFKTLTVTVRYKGFITKTKAKTLPHFTDDEAAIRSGAQALLRDLFDGRKIRPGLRLSTLEKHDARQTTLF